MQEVLPGVFHWTAVHPRIGVEVSSHFDAGSGTAFDPLLPPAGIEWFEAHPVQRIVLSNRHHLRHSERIAAHYGCPILCHRAGLHEFTDGPQVQGFLPGEELAPGIAAREMSAICPDDTVLRIDAGDGGLLFADSVIHYGGLGFVSDRLIGDDPEGVKRRTRELCAELVDEPFDTLLFAHGTPLIGGGREALRRFAAGDAGE
jgi:hypothetical protein